MGANIYIYIIIITIQPNFFGFKKKISGDNWRLLVKIIALECVI